MSASANVERYKRACAVEIGCQIEDFSSDRLTVLARPDECWEPFIVKIITFGSGTVMSVDRTYFEFVRTLVAEPHYRALHPPVVLAPLVDEAARRGKPSAGMALASDSLPLTLAISPCHPASA